MNKNGTYILYGNVLSVKGFSRSALYDLQFNKIELIPNELYDLFNNGGVVLNDYSKYNLSLTVEELEEYIEYLVDLNLVFHTYFPELFPKISTTYCNPYIITNAIIDIETDSFANFNYTNVLEQLENLGCTAIQLNLLNLNKNDFDKIKEIISAFEIGNIFLILSENKDFNINDFTRLNSIKTIIIHSSKPEKIQEQSNTKIFFIKKELKSCCSNAINPELFTINMDFVIESINYNSCLNRKLYIDKNGEVKNCPMIERKYGNILENNIIDIVNKKEFQELWTINKDKIEVCKDCELRYMCFDCRANLKTLYSAPSCKYNPYTGKWRK